MKLSLKRRLSRLKNHRHTVCIVLTLLFCLTGAFCFQDSYKRLIEALSDFGLSFVYAFGADVTPDVTEPPSVELPGLGLLPSDIDTAAIKFRLYLKLLLTDTSFIYYGYFISNVMLVISYVMLIFIPFGLILTGLFWLSSRRVNNEYNKDTLPYAVVKKIAQYTYNPVKRWLKSFKDFISERKYYLVIWSAIWAFNFNFPTILIEIFAFYFYFVATFELSSIYFQLYKLTLDLSLVIRFIPWWLWVIIAVALYNFWRRRHAFKKLKCLEEADEDFVKNMSVSNLIVAPMNMKKTTLLTDIAITLNKVYRDVAYEKILDNDLKFPNFPWINLERCIKFGMENHMIYNLATCKKFTDTVRAVYERSTNFPGLCELFATVLKRKYGYNYSNYIFGYDVERYGATYYDKLECKTIFEVIETYTKLFFIYVMTCNFIFSSYSIRTDDFLKDNGNFPLWDTDFFKRDEKLMRAHSRHSHILDYEALRLGKKVSKSSKFKDSIDFGIIAITEIGKERGNQKTQRGGRQDDGANQNNDLFGIDIKMCRHRATVDNFPFVAFISDEQRAASLNADERELGDVLNIKDSSDFKIITPLYAPDELIFIAATKLFNNFYKNDRFYKGNNSLLRRVVKSLYGVIYRHYHNVFNQFSACTLKLSVQNGKLDDKEKANKYRLSKKKIHSARFSTDAYAQFYYEKTKRSPVGIVDVPEYSGKVADLGELEFQHSYFVEDITKYFISKKAVSVTDESGEEHLKLLPSKKSL